MITLAYFKHKIVSPAGFLEYSNNIVRDKLMSTSSINVQANGLHAETGVKGYLRQSLNILALLRNSGKHERGEGQGIFKVLDRRKMHAWYFHFDRHRFLRKHRDSMEMALWRSGAGEKARFI
jgi:hypothetical protein